MTTTRLQSRTIVCALVYLALASPMAALADDGTSASKATHASCLITITPGSSATALNADTIAEIIKSVGVSGAAIRDMLGIAMPPDGELLEISFDAIDNDVDSELSEVTGAPITGRLYVEYYNDLAEYRTGADELLNAVTARLSKVMAELGASQRAILERQRAVAEDDVKETKTRLAKLQAMANAMRNEAGRSDLSRDAVIDEVRELESQLRDTEIEAASQRARRDAIAAQIAKIGETVKSNPGGDEVAAAMHQVVELRQMQLERAEQLAKAQQAGQAEVKQAEVELAMARADLVRHMEEMADAAGGGAMADLNQELTRMSIEGVEVEAKQKALQDRLEHIRSTHLLDLADQYEREVRVQRDVAEYMLEEALRREALADRLMRSFQPPSLVVIGGGMQ